MIVLGKCSFIGEETVMESEESSPVYGISGEEERSISVESSVSSTWGGGKNDMMLGGELFKLGRKNGDAGKKVDIGLAHWG